MLEVVARNCNETPGSVLSVRTLAGFCGQYYADVFTASATPTEIEHDAEVARVKIHPVFLPMLSEGKLVWDD